MHKSTAAVLIVVGLTAGLVAGFVLGNRYVTRAGYQDLRERGFTEKEIADAIRAMPDVQAIQRGDADVAAMRLALVYKLLLLDDAPKVRANLQKWLRDYYKAASQEAGRNEKRMGVLRRIESLTEWDKDLLKGIGSAG